MTLIQSYPIPASLIFSFGLNLLFFFFAAVLKTDKVTDLSYNLSFFLLAPLMLVAGGSYWSLNKLLVTGAVMLWALRLGSYLFYRILKIGRDHRFDDRRGKPLEFLKFWLLQAFAVWLVMTPFTLFLTNPYGVAWFHTTIAGLGIYLTGLLIETVSDIQKFRYRRNPKNEGHWMDRGLWKYSRHPNYFGEMLVWWGLFLVVAPPLRGLAWLSVSGPLFITAALLFITGVPPLEKSAEKRYGADPEYQAYKSRSRLLLPLPWAKRS